VQLTQLQSDALREVGEKNWKGALETFSEIKSEIERGEVPDDWKKNEADMQEKIILLQKIRNGEKFESDKDSKREDASKEYQGAQRLQERQKLPGVTEWLAVRMKVVGFDETAFKKTVLSARESVRNRKWAEADKLLKEAAAVNLTPELKALLELAADALTSEALAMTLVVDVNKVLKNEAYTRQSIFCIDRYEWPNVKGGMPLANKSYVEAKALCEGAGKRLCKDFEWEDTCKGEGNNWPYGPAAIAAACNTGGTAAVVSGSKETCATPSGVYDMSGNLAEWTDGAKPLVIGGSYEDAAANASCSNRVAPEKTSAAIGFRCCISATKLNWKR